MNILEFTSARKRMSVIVKDLKTDEIKLLSKGADSIMMDLADKSARNKTNLSVVSSMVNEFSVVGLRTLILAEKVLKREFYEDWNTKFQHANSLIKGRDEEVAKVNE